jgi:hypothetical protein
MDNRNLENNALLTKKKGNILEWFEHKQTNKKENSG